MAAVSVKRSIANKPENTFVTPTGIRTHGLSVSAAVLYHGCLNCNHLCDYPIFIQKSLHYKIGSNLALHRFKILKVTEHSLGSLWVYVICQIMARERLQFTSWNVAKETYTHKRLWLAGKMCRFRSFHGNMNDWIQPSNFTFAQFT